MPTPPPVDLEDLLLVTAAAMVRSSGGRLRLAKNEKDDTTGYARSDDFLKLDGKRLGRDFALYARMSGMTGMGGIGATLIDITAEIMHPLRDEIPASFQAGVDKMAEMAHLELKEPAAFEAWEELLAEQPPRPPMH